jgi:hypothetical protein
VQFVTAATLVASMAKAHGERRLEDRLMGFAKPKLLILDEHGYLPLEPDADAIVATALMLIGLHPAPIVTARHQSLADRVGLFAGSGRKQNKAMPNAFLAHVDGLRLSLSV